MLNKYWKNNKEIYNNKNKQINLKDLLNIKMLQWKKLINYGDTMMKLNNKQKQIIIKKYI